MFKEKIKPKSEFDLRYSFDEDPEKIHEGKWGGLHVYSGGSYLSTACLYDTEEEMQKVIERWISIVERFVSHGSSVCVTDDTGKTKLYVYDTDFLMLIPMPVKGD